MSAHASGSFNHSAGAKATKKSASAHYENTVTAEAGAHIGGNHASAGVGLNVKTGTKASASTGLDGNNVYANVEYSDTTEAHITADAQAEYTGFGAAVGVDAYAKSGTEAEGHLSVGQKGVDVGASASVGTAVGVDATGTVALREASATGGAGVSVGEHFEAGGSATATFEQGKANVGVSGDVAALVGIEADVSVTVDTNQIQEDTTTVTHAVVDTGKKVEDAVVDAGKKTGNAIKKAFHF
jgi:hypothetical protein